jgi:hypothetical protein
MDEEFLGERRKALEEVFFAKQNEKLRQKIREKEAAKAKKQALSAASGITDERLLEHLMALGIESDTLAALSLVPLVQVAWADGRIDDKERDAVLSGAEEAGLQRGTLSYQLLEGWLARWPDPVLFVTWKEYVAALSKKLGAESATWLKQDILGRARAVAQAAGGFRGLGSKISRAEYAVLKQLDEAFSEN